MHTSDVSACLWGELNRRLNRLAPYLVWPGLLALSGLFIGCLLALEVDAGTALFAAFFFSLGCMALLEALLPFRKDWQGSRREWLSNAVYFLLNGLNANLAGLLTALVAIRLAPEQSGMPLSLALLMAVLIGSFAGYWWHRLGHSSTGLWRFHGVHHVPGKLFMFNNNTVHFVDLLVANILSTLPLVVLGFSEQVIAIAAFFANFQGFYNHLNVDARMGWLGYLFMGPEHHRFHHSQRIEEAGNFSSEVALWDQLFGTFNYRPGRQPARIGINGAHGFPDDVRVMRSFLDPFKKR